MVACKGLSNEDLNKVLEDSDFEEDIDDISDEEHTYNDEDVSNSDSDSEDVNELDNADNKFLVSSSEENGTKQCLINMAV